MAYPGKRPDYSERMARKRTAATIKFYLLAIILGGLIGVAYMKRDELKTAYDNFTNKGAPPPVQPAEKVPATVPHEPVPTPSAPPAAKVPEPSKPTEPVVTQNISPRDEAEARRLIGEGKASLEKFDLAGAAKRFDEASAVKASSATRNDAKGWKGRALQYQNATKHIPVSSYAESDSAWVVETSEAEWRGLKIRETDENLFFQAIPEGNPATEGKQILPIPKSDIKKMTPIPLKQRQDEFSALLKSMEASTTITHSSDYYDLVYLSKRLGLLKECLEYLNKAFDGGPGHEPDPNLGDSFRSVVVRRVIGRASLLMTANRRTQVELELKKLNDTLPDYGPASEEVAAFRTQVMNKVTADFQPSVVLSQKESTSAPRRDNAKKMQRPAEENVIDVGVDNSKLRSSGPAAQVLDRGNLKFEEGMAIVRKYKLGTAGNKNENNRILMAAKVSLMEAIDIYEEALKLEPSNKSIRDRQQTASTMVYFCNKNLILG
jgi:tetratricopeptide (TPR) repeat protein